MSIVAIRKSVQSVAGPFALRTDVFSDLVTRWQSALHRFEEESDRLESVLYKMVGGEQDVERRHAALQCKRAVHARRAVASDDLLMLDAEIARELSEWESLRSALKEVAPEDEVRIRNHVEEKLQTLWRKPVFRAAIRYSSTTLAQLLSEAGGPEAGERVATKMNTSLYRYAAKFFAKANPLYLFAEIGFPTLPLQAPRCEIFRDVFAQRASAAPEALDDDVRVFPGLLVRGRGDTGTTFDVRNGYLRSVGRHVLSDDAEAVWQWCDRPGGRSLDELQALCTGKALPFAEGSLSEEDLDGWFDAGFLSKKRVPNYLPTVHAGQKAASVQKAALLSIPTGAGKTSVGDASAALRSRAEHMSPPDAPSEGFSNTTHAADADGRRISISDAIALAETPTSSLLADGEPAYYINRFMKPELVQQAEPVSDAVLDDLSQLRPLLGAFPLGASDRNALRRIVRKQSGPVGVMELLLALETPDHPVGTAYRKIRKQERMSVRDKRKKIHSQETVEAALEASRAMNSASVEAPMLVNGPYDEKSGRFYLSNIWGRPDRFTARYRLAEAPPVRLETTPDMRSGLVQIYDPLGFMMNLVGRYAPTGCGFASEYSGRFDEWIQPSDILLCPEGEGVVYRQASTGKKIYPRYFGMMLLSQIPLAYKLLTLNQRGTCHSPFDGIATFDSDQIEEIPERTFGAVTLQRRRWVVGTDLIPEQRPSDVDDALHLALWIHREISDEDRFYYRIAKAESFGHKPRFLDTRSVLSLGSLRRDLRSAGEGARLVLEPMRPLPEHQFRAAGEPVSAERMIAVP